MRVILLKSFKLSIFAIMLIVMVLFAVTADTAPATAAVGGPVFLSGDDADDYGHCSGATACGGLYANILEFAVQNSGAPGTLGDIVAIGPSGQALTALNNWNGATTSGPYSITVLATTAQIAAVNFSDYKLLYIPSDFNTSGGISSTLLAALNLRQSSIQSFVNISGGGLVALTEGASGANAYGWLPIPLTTSPASHTTHPITPTAALITLSPSTTTANLTHCCLHNTFTGPVGFSGLEVLAFHNHGGSSGYEHGTDEAVILGGAQVVIQGNISLTPANDTNDVGDAHTVTATVLDGSPAVPSVGTLVSFSITGPNAGAPGTCSVNPGCTTDANGQVSFTYTGTVAGSDVITASFVDQAGDTQAAVAGKLWVAADTEPPTTVKTFTLATSGMWNNGPVVLEFNATDTGSPASGVKEIHVEIDDGTTVTPYVFTGNYGTITLTADGHYTVTFWAVDNAGNVERSQTQMHWIDSTPPEVSCNETTNPSGKNVPKAGKDAGKSGQNPDGFYVLGVWDALSGADEVWLEDDASPASFGPYPTGTVIKLTQAPGVTPNEKPGAGVVDWKIQINGDGVATATDAAGNTATAVCLVPRPPK